MYSKIIFPTAVLLVLIAALSGFWALASAASAGPSVALTSTITSPTNSASIPITATFSTAVTGFGTSSISVTNGTATGTVSDMTGSSTTFMFTIVPSTEGTVTVKIPADMVATSTEASSTNQESNTLSFVFRTSPPVISDLSVVTSTSSATLTWNTDESADWQIFYGTSTDYGATSTKIAVFETAHAATLTGLEAATTYHYKIFSVDEAGNLASSTDATFTTGSPPALTPTISNITLSNIGTTGATIGWLTDLPASSHVFYGTSAGYGQSSVFDPSPTTTHSVSLQNLTEATLYHIAASSMNANGTTTSSDFVFVTQSTASTTPLAVSGIDTVRSSATADGTFSNGWEWVLHFVVPSVENIFSMKFSDFTSSGSSSTIPAANNIRFFSPQSSNASSSGFAILESGNGYGSDLLLTGDTSSTTPGRQIDVNVQVSVPPGTQTGVYSTFFGARSSTSTGTTTSQ